MKVPLSWLSEWIDLSSLSLEQLEETLTLAGLEVEGKERILDDTIFEVALTPNLGHCLSILGIARELSALLKRPLKQPPFHLEESGDPISKEFSVELRAPHLCPRYAARLVRDIHLNPSPDWMRRRLEAAGMRSVDVVVDVTNYVMLEMGQPLHAFDADKIGGKEILIATLEKERPFPTLDGAIRTIAAGTLLITNKSLDPLAIAGVLGGSFCAISPKTKSVLLEAAVFSPQAVRRAMKQLHLRTESGMRFERGIDGSSLLNALTRAASLLAELTGGVVARGAIDVAQVSFAPRPLSVRLKRVNQLLGTHFSLGEVASIFERLGMAVAEDEEKITALIPSYRNDLCAEIDLIEEVARLYGYNNIPRATPKYTGSSLAHTPLFSFEREIRSQLVGQGLQEWITCDLISPQLIAIAAGSGMGKEASIEVLHPRSLDQSILRTSLLPGMLEVVKRNANHQTRDLAAFEIGKIHFRANETCQEQMMVGLLFTGACAPYHFDPKPKKWDFFDLKGRVENIFHALGLRKISFLPSQLESFHPGRQARVEVEGSTLGVMGEIHPTLLHALDMKEAIIFAEFNIHDLLCGRTKNSAVAELPLYPASLRDWTFIAEENLAVSRVLEVIHALGEPFLESVSLLDLYKSEQIGKDRKSLTFRFVYRDVQRTMEQTAVDACHARIIGKATHELALAR